MLRLSKTAESKAPSVDELEEVFKLMYGEEPAEKPYEPTWKCTKCGNPMQCLEFQLRPSWRLIFERLNHQADKDNQQWLWSLSELHALRGGANPNGSQSTAATSILAEAATQNATQNAAAQKSKSSSLKALTNPAILDSS